MRTKRHWRPKPKPPQFLFRINDHIRATEVMLIDEEEKNLGPMPTNQALELARERGFDLVEVFPKAAPPVAKLLNYGQLQYEEQKKKRAQKVKQKNLEIKGVRLSLRIGQHDLDNRLRQTEGFLEAGHPVKLELVLRGRERNYAHNGREQLMDIVNSLKNFSEPEGGIQLQNGRLSIIIRPSKRKEALTGSDEHKKPEPSSD